VGSGDLDGGPFVARTVSASYARFEDGGLERSFVLIDMFDRSMTCADVQAWGSHPDSLAVGSQQLRVVLQSLDGGDIAPGHFDYDPSGGTGLYNFWWAEVLDGGQAGEPSGTHSGSVDLSSADLDTGLSGTLDLRFSTYALRCGTEDAPWFDPDCYSDAGFETVGSFFAPHCQL
jgi:hypothetical protein